MQTGIRASSSNRGSQPFNPHVRDYLPFHSRPTPQGPSLSSTNNPPSITGDLSNPAGVQSIITSITNTHSTLDVLIHCAAYRHMNPITYTPGSSITSLQTATSSASWEKWDYSFQLNVLAPYFLAAGLIKLLGPSAHRNGESGSIILFSSPASVHNHQFVPAYQTTKAAVDHLVRILAAEFADFYSKSTLLLLAMSFFARFNFPYSPFD